MLRYTDNTPATVGDIVVPTSVASTDPAWDVGRVVRASETDDSAIRVYWHRAATHYDENPADLMLATGLNA